MERHIDQARARTATNIAKLKQMNSSLSRNFVGKSSIKHNIHHAKPFIPSSPISRNVVITSPTRKPSLIAKLAKTASPKTATMKRMTETEERYVEWDVPRTLRTSPRKPSINPIAGYEVDMNTANWQSEQKMQYNKDRDFRVRSSGESFPTVESSNQDFPIYEKEYQEPFHETKEDVSFLVKAKSQPNTLASEYVKQYNWPIQSERAHIALPQHTTNPIPMYEGAADEGQWQSEYDQRSQELRQRQRELQSGLNMSASNDRPAGLMKPRHEATPAFYAWEGKSENYSGEQPRKLGIRPEFPSEAPMSRKLHGISEYKRRFPEWPMSQTDAVKAREDTLDVFHKSLSTNENPMDTSYRASYPGHDPTNIRIMNQQNVPNFEAYVETQTNPKMFAWPPVDVSGNPVDVDFQQGEPKEPHRRNYALHHQSTEYMKKYKWPVTNSHEVPNYARQDQLNLFDGTNGAMDSPKRGSGALAGTEHKDRFKDFSQYTDMFGNPLVNPAVTRSKGLSQCPTQFAWALVNGGDDGTNDDERETQKIQKLKVRVNSPNKENSEYTSKFLWPPLPETEEPGEAERKEQHQHLLRYGHSAEELLSLDKVEPLHQSEANEKLRKSQILLRNGLGGEHHAPAGVPNFQRHDTPTYYAWHDPPPPPVLPPPTAGADGYDHISSEYLEKFKRWQQSNDRPIAQKTKDTLNVFEGDSLEDRTGVTPSSTIPHSEYKDNFQRFARLEDSNPAGGPIGAQQDQLPAHFAWPRVDPLPKEHVEPPVPTGDRGQTSGRQSEHDSRFKWFEVDQTAPTAQTVLAHQQHPTNVFGLTNDKEGKEKQWKTEYKEASAKATNKEDDWVKKNRAGIITMQEGDVPLFWAWADKEQKRPKSAPPARKKLPPNFTEYDDQFVKWNTTEPVAAIHPTTASDTLNVFEHQEYPTDHPVTSSQLLTEYDAEFQALPGEGARESYGPPDEAVMPFASDLDSLPPPPPTRVSYSAHQQRNPPTGRFKGVTEYDDRFRWSQENINTKKEKPSYKINQSSVPLVTDPAFLDAGKTWKTEYAESNEAVLKYNETSSERPSRVAGVVEDKEMPAPQFYAWPLPPENKSSRPSTTDNNLDKSAKMATSGTMGPFSGGNRPSWWTTEYDDNFGPNLSQALTLPINRVNTAVKPGLGDSTKAKARPSSAPPASRRPTPTMVSHKSKPIFGRVSSINKMEMDEGGFNPLSFNPSSSVASRASGLMDKTGLTESQANYVWPGKEKAERLNDIIEKPKQVQVKKKKGPKDYKLISRTMKPKEPAGRISRPFISTVRNGPSTRVSPSPPRVYSFATRGSLPSPPPGTDKHARSTFSESAGDFESFSPPPVPRAESSINDQSSAFDKTQTVVTDGSVAGSDYASTARSGTIRSETFKSDISSRGPTTTNQSRESSQVYSNSSDPYSAYRRGGQEDFSRDFTEVKTDASVCGNSTIGGSESRLSGSATSSVNLTNRTKPDPLQYSAPISGLRDTAEERNRTERTRSAPPRQRLSVTYAADVPSRSSKIFVDNSASNPILLNKRYPYVNNQQMGHWLTETRDRFRGRKLMEAPTHVSLH